MADQEPQSQSLDTIFNSAASDAPASSTTEPVISSTPTPVVESSPVKDDSVKTEEEQPTATSKDGETEVKTADTTIKTSEAEAKVKADEAAAKVKTDAAAHTEQEVTFEKRWKDTVSWANQLKQENGQLSAAHRELQKQVEILKKQIADPEYDPAADPANQGPTSEQIAVQALTVGKTVASRNAAYQTYGKESVDNALTHFHALFGENAIVQQVVQQSEAPVQEAIGMVERYYFEQKYGNTPRAIFAAIEKEVTEKQRATLRKEILDEIQTGKKKKDGVVEGLSTSRGNSGIDRSENAKSSDTPLSSIFS